MNDPIQLRRYVREVMMLAPENKFTERMIFDGVKALAREPLSVVEFKAALNWNFARDYIASEADEDEALPGEQAPLRWSITPDGRKKEGHK